MNIDPTTKWAHILHLANVSNRCFFTIYSFNLILVFPPSRQDFVRCLIMELLSFPIASNSEQSPLKPFPKSTNTSPNPTKVLSNILLLRWPHDFYSVHSPLMRQLINSTCSTIGVFLVVFGWKAVTLYIREKLNKQCTRQCAQHLQDSFHLILTKVA